MTQSASNTCYALSAEAAVAYAEYLRLAPAAPDAQAVRERVAQLTGATTPSSGPSSE